MVAPFPWIAMRPLNPLPHVASLRDHARSVPEQIAFWSEGGLRLTQPVPRGDGPPAYLTLLLQPDGDVVLSVPRRFGESADDAAAARALFVRAEAALLRLSRTGFGALANLAPAVMHLTLAAIWLWALFPPWTPATTVQVGLALISSVAAIIMHRIGRPWLRARAEAWLIGRIRARMR